MRVYALLLLALLPLTAGAAARTEADARAVEIYRAGLDVAVSDMQGITSRAGKRILSAEEKQDVRRTWSAFLDYLLALDSIGSFHRDLKSEPAMVVTYAAFLAQYRAALAMIDVAEELPGADAVLNEPAPRIGLPEGSYARVKVRWLNVARASEFAALESLYLVRRGSSYPRLRAAINTDARAILRSGRGKGPAQTAANALKIAGSTAFTAWFPVQKGVAEWMGDTRVARAHQFLVTKKQIDELAPRLQPGDVFLERREWYLSNIGLPGFWPHTALFIGDAEQRRRYFDDDDVRAWVRQQGRADGDFEALLHAQSTKAHPKSRGFQVIEAISEGVSFTTLDHSAAADSLAILRPRATKRDKAIAIARAFGYIGRPYDFNFDFHTDTALVCSEVIYKAYEGSVTLPLSESMGHLVTAPNEIVRELDSTFGTPAQQFDFVLFLDGHEKRRVAVPGTLEEFRASWKRPKWHIVKQ